MNFPGTLSRESANFSITETFINLLVQNRAKKVGGKEEGERICHQVQLSIKKNLRSSSSQVHGDIATIWPNH